VTTLEPRLMSGSSAAAYCGVTLATWSKWVATGIMPKPLPGTRRWDRKAIDLTLDKASGITTVTAPEDEDPLEAWSKWDAENQARKATARHGSELEKQGTQKVARKGRQRTYAEPRVSIEEALEAARVALLDMKKE
jgi:hypothetical protein